MNKKKRKAAKAAREKNKQRRRPNTVSIWPNGTFVGNALNTITASFTGDNNLAPESAGNAKDKLPDSLRSAIDGLKFRHEVGHADATPILAYRGWADAGGRLTSIGIGTVAWPTRRRFEAVCHRGAPGGYEPTPASGFSGGGGGGLPAHNAPHQDCTCGVYGFATPASSGTGLYECGAGAREPRGRGGDLRRARALPDSR